VAQWRHRADQDLRSGSACGLHSPSAQQRKRGAEPGIR
jgi:hypothetical protein